MKSLDQATLASRVGLSKSSISRIFSGIQEPKLSLANDLAKALGVTLDYLVEDSAEIGPSQHVVTMTDEELMILKIVRRLGSNVAIDRLLNVETMTHPPEMRDSAPVVAGRIRGEASRFPGSPDDRSDSWQRAVEEPRDG
jgi:transcriptional regulator with XRE-family HTH domain